MRWRDELELKAVRQIWDGMSPEQRVATAERLKNSLPVKHVADADEVSAVSYTRMCS